MPDDAKAPTDLVARLEAVEKDLSEKIVRLNDAKRKDIWDKLGSLGGILVAVIGAIFSYMYQNHQNKQDAILKAEQTHLQQIQTVAPFMSYLTGPDDKARTVALFEVKDLLSPEVAVALAINVNSAGNASGRSGPDKGVVNFLKEVQQTGNTSSARQLAGQALRQVCGLERWSVKTVADQGAAAVLAHASAPVSYTVEELADLPRPGTALAEDSRMVPTEQTVYRVTATMISVKHEMDGDYHMVLQGSTGKTMVAEIPSPDCYSGDRAEVASDFQTARGVVDSLLATSSAESPVRTGGSPSVLQRQRTSVRVTVTGVGFFDFPHGQLGMAANGLELHPVLKIDAASP